MSTLDLFLPLTKVDVDARMVHGVATAESPDRSGEICDYETTKPYFQSWSEDARAASGGKSLGAVRAMHGRIAAGKLTDISFDDDNRRILVAAKIVDDDEWEKVLEGVYTGFSQGGRYVKRWSDDCTGFTRYTAEPTEISLVDVRCLPNATFEVVKDGVVENRAFASPIEPAQTRIDHMPSGGVETPIPTTLFARLTAATRFVISGAGPESWFGPQQPLVPQAPPEVKGRQWDYPFGINISYTPRSDSQLSFGDLRALADSLPLLRAVIETRKDQIAAMNWTVRGRLTGVRSGAAARAERVREFLANPDRRHDFATWLRMIVEDMLVIDAASIYPRYSRSGVLYSLDVVDGATIKPVIGEDGRSPEPPNPAYQQVLHGVSAADFSSDELLYIPRNVRSHRLYGLSPVEQIALTINIALRREQGTLDYYNTGSMPDSFATLPKEWTVDQIRQFQDYFDALMSGNLARRRMVKFMPADFKLTETRQPPLKDQYDEWLAKVICYAFSVPASAFVSQVNRATSQTLRTQATQEGLVPLNAWVKMAMDRVIGACFGDSDLEFYWVGDDALDPLEQAQTISILVGAGIKTVAEARAELGLGQAAGIVKHKPYGNEERQFTSAESPDECNENIRTPGG